MPDPCKYDNEADFVSDCISERQRENPDEDIEQSTAICYQMWRDRDCSKAKVFKSGEQSPDDPWEFIMSTDAVDRMGDIVEQDWHLREFKKNPIALYQHNHTQPIGKWERVRVEDGKLRGFLRLAKAGTSELIDTIRSLIEQRILKAVSVGFIPKSYEPLDEDDPWGGYRLSDNHLLECSLVSIPANQEALSLAKSLGSGVRELLFRRETTAGPEFLPASRQLGFDMSRDSDRHLSIKRQSRKKTMSLSEKIEAAEKNLVALKDQLTVLMQKTFEDEDSDEKEENDIKIDELTRQIDVVTSDIDRAKRAESALKRESTPAPRSSDAPATPAAASSGSAPVPRIEARTKRAKGYLAFASLAAYLKGHLSRQSPLEIAKSAYRDDYNSLEVVIRAATSPADMTTPGWAAELVRETWGEFLELLRDISVYPRLPGMRLEFDRYGKINIPRNEGRGKLAGGFVAEGAPIPVKEGLYGQVDLTPKKIAVISTFTKEIGMHSMPSIQQLIQTQILGDTAEVLDTLYLDAEARTAIRPAGLQDPTETGAANINAASGNTVADIISDTEGMVSRLLTARAGEQAVWLLNPIHLLTLSNLQDAASGAFVFRAEINNGRFMGYPYISSQNVTPNLLILQSNQAVTYANDYAPMFDISDQATIVFDDTAPGDISDGAATPALPANQPIKSLYQVDSIGVKMTQGLDWRIVRVGGVQVLTGFLV